MEQMMNQINQSHQNGSGDNSPSLAAANRSGMASYQQDQGPSPFAGAGNMGQMNHMALMSQMSQFQGMMGGGAVNGGMPGNPQDMMNMMAGSYCGPTNSGPGAPSMAAMYGGGFSGQDGQGMGSMNQMAQMMRKRPMMEGYGDDDVQGPPSKRPNYGQTSDMAALENTNESLAAPAAADDDDEKPSSAPASPRKEHVAIPPSKEGIKFYSRNDVLCGRGGGTNVHPGNRRFRDLINANRRAYLKARKNDKPAISRSIVRTIREMNGRFLKKEEKLGLWFEIGDDGAREKTSQALRQRAPEMRKILFEDEQRQQHVQQQELMQRHQLMGMGQGMPPGMGQGMMGPGMGGNFAQGAMAVSQQGSSGGQGPNNQNNAESLLAKYNMLHQKNWLAQEKNMILQRLAMSGMNSQQLDSNQSNIGNMTTQALLQQGIKPVTPRGA